MEVRMDDTPAERAVDDIVDKIDTFLEEPTHGKAVFLEMGVTAQISLLQQLHDLYAEIEAAGGRRPGELAEENAALRQQLGDLRQSLHVTPKVAESSGSVSEGGKPEGPELVRGEVSPTAEEARPSQSSSPDVASAESPFVRIGSSGVSKTEALVAAFSAQFEALYSKKSEDLRDAIIHGLDDKLRSLYQDEEHEAAVIESLVAQLEDLYRDRELANENRETPVHGDSTESSEGQSQVDASATAKLELEEEIRRLTTELASVRERAIRMAAAITESALA